MTGQGHYGVVGIGGTLRDAAARMGVFVGGNAHAVATAQHGQVGVSVCSLGLVGSRFAGCDGAPEPGGSKGVVLLKRGEFDV
jgi:hypothetical protein